VPIRDNKFARRAKDLEMRGKNLVRDAQPTPEEQLARLEEDIRRLKIEFDIYFNGGAKRPPYDTKGRVDTLIKRLADDRGLSFAQRYHYNSLAARYNSFMQLWRRTMQDREEGRGKLAPRQVAHATVPEAEPSQFICADAKKDISTVRSLYDKLVEAKRKCGESTDDLSFPRFHRMIAEKSEALKEHANCERVQFSVTIRDGHVSFKAKADR
jgi:hypothetical protein